MHMNKQDHPIFHDVPIGIDATGQRHETDSMGGIDVPADRYWGAQTQRSLVHFSIGDDHMPKRVYHAYGYVKKAAALVNEAAGRLPQWKADAVAHAVEHERQRSAVEPCRPTARRQDRQQVSSAPKRRRQYGPVVERYLPDGNAHRRRARAGGA